MPEHKCIKEDQLTRIEQAVNRIDTSLRGSDGKGLFTEFAVWKNTVAGLIVLNMIIVTGLIGLWLTK